MTGGAWKRYVLVAGAAAATLAVFAVIYGWLPWWIDGARLRGLSPKDQAGILSSDRGDVLKMVAGAGAVVALVYTARKHALDRHGQLTDRYSKAITQLASEKESERIGGIYALERVMRDSVRDHPTVVEVLAAFVREQAPLPDAAPGGSQADGGAPGTGIRERPHSDVQAAMTVLARRPERAELFELDLRRTQLVGLELPPAGHLARANLAQANLTGASLNKAMLTGANLTEAVLTNASLNTATLTEAKLGGAILTKAHLNGAKLTGATLSDAILTKAYLSEANLDGASLTNATLNGANLSSASLIKTVLYSADLSGANLVGAKLTRAYLLGAVLKGAQNLHPSQLADALVTAETVLDAGYAMDVWVVARIEACQNWNYPNPVPAPTRNPDRPPRPPR